MARQSGSNAAWVWSEVGALRGVLVHSPGPELLAVTPANRRDFLFDDLIDLTEASREHARFKALLERFAEVHEVRDLLTEIVEMPEARRYLLEASRDVIDEARERELYDAPADRFVRVFIEGEEHRGGALAEYLNAWGYAWPPLPNLYYTRDSAMVTGSRVVIASMRHEVRWSEELLMKALFKFHPLLANDGILYDGAEEKRVHHAVEGGDVHVLRRDLILVGQSDRSSAAAIDLLAEAWFREMQVRDVLVVVMPRSSAVCIPRTSSGPPASRCSICRRGRRGCRRCPTCSRASRAWGSRSSRSSAAVPGAHCRTGSSGRRGATFWRSGRASSSHIGGTRTRWRR